MIMEKVAEILKERFIKNSIPAL